MSKQKTRIWHVGLACLAIMISLIAGTRTSIAQESVFDATHIRSDLPHASDRILVKLQPRVDKEDEVGGAQRVFDRWVKVAVPQGRTPLETVEDFILRPGVETVALDHILQIGPITPVALDHNEPLDVDDPLLSFQWHFPAVQVEAAWADGTGNGVTVAVVDTGISQDGEDLVCHTFVSPYNAITDTAGFAAAEDDHGHGTHVAGTVAQCTDNEIGVAGVAFDASLMPVKVLDSNGSGSVSSLAGGIEWARAHGAEVINLSLGFDDPDFSHPMIDDALEAAAADEIVIVAASGNSNWSSVAYPANHPDVIAVGATEFNNERAPYSNRGSALDLVAPGGDLTQDANEDGYGDGVLQETFTNSNGWAYYFFNGTSMAAPHVAGAAALLLSSDPGLDPLAVQQVLESTALDLGDSGFDTTYGHGLIQIHDALEFLTAPDTTAPSWPENSALSASGVTGTSVGLSWPDADDDRSVAGYRIYQDGALIAETGPSKTSTTVSGLSPATNYSFAVRAKDLAGNLSAALSVNVTTLDTVAPTWSAGSELGVQTYGETQLTLSWNGAMDNVGVTGYRLRLTGTLGTLVSGTSATITGLESGTAYEFEVLARDKAGNWSVALFDTVRTARSFTDTQNHLFYQDILWMSGSDITRGCNPPVNDMFCPDDPVTRAQMAAFLARALGLTENSHPGFVDVAPGSTFAEDVGRLATAGVTRGCNPPANDMFCPNDPVTRAQMAAFVTRALGLIENGHPGFVDVAPGSTFGEDVGRLATAGVTSGCNPPVNDMFCPDDPVTRGQLAAFLKRALD